MFGSIKDFKFKTLEFLPPMSRLINEDVARFLNLTRLPWRLTLGQAAAVLGVGDHDVPTLIRAGLLRPLGRPEANAPKFFSSKIIDELARDPEAMDQMVRAISKGWRVKNKRERNSDRPSDATIVRRGAMEASDEESDKL